MRYYDCYGGEGWRDIGFRGVWRNIKSCTMGYLFGYLYGLPSEGTKVEGSVHGFRLCHVTSVRSTVRSNWGDHGL